MSFGIPIFDGGLTPERHWSGGRIDRGTSLELPQDGLGDVTGQAGGLALECHWSDRGIGPGMSLVPVQKLVKNLKSHIDISIVVFPPVPVPGRPWRQLRYLTPVFAVLIIRTNVRASGFRLDSCCRLYQCTTTGLSNFLFIRISKYYRRVILLIRHGLTG